MEFRIDVVTGIVISASLWLVTGQKYPNKIQGCIVLLNIFEPCGCTLSEDTFDPLCASDGHTYLSECSFHCQKALSKVEISVANTGACSDTIKCFCQTGYVPQCGTDDVTYPNECVLACFMKKDNTLRLKHTGECVSNWTFDHVEPEYLNDDPENQNNNPEIQNSDPEYENNIEVSQNLPPENCCCCQCCPSNLRRLRTRFGNNGKRYARSSCNCRHKTKTEAPRTPPPAKLTAQPPNCPSDSPPPIQPLTSQGCPNQPQACQLKEPERNPKKKRCVCAMLNRPVCGNNKETYSNFCVVYCTSRRNPSVRFRHWGKCGRPQKTPWDFE